MSKKHTHQSGIETNPVHFEAGVLLPPDLSKGPQDSQNLWHSIINNRDWVMNNVLGMNPGSIDEPYVETTKPRSVVEQWTKMSELAESDAFSYTDERNIRSLGALLFASDQAMRAEFKRKTVLDIGSGAGRLGRSIGGICKQFVNLDIFHELLATFPNERNRISPVVGDGLDIPFADGTFDRTISMYSTSVHTDTIGERLRALTEMLRVTKEDGRAIIVPLLGGMVSRQRQWIRLHTHGKKALTPEQWDSFREMLRREAAIDVAMTNVLEKVMTSNKIQFTPILAQQQTELGVLDGVSGIIDVRAGMSKDEARELVQDTQVIFQ